jgi:flavin-dependent dehydrogenase
MTETEYDVIIVGGRVAGSTLAAYLGQAEVRVLLLERATFPEDHPASSPMVQPSTLAMLDEIGADESAYAHNTPKIGRMIGVIDADTALALDIPEINGRNYGYAVDRARFDAALWDNALRYPTVSGHQGFAVNSLLWDDDGQQVIGLEGRFVNNGEKAQYTAKCVVGADGRFSTVARKVEAPERDKRSEHPTTIYYGYWRNVRPFDEGSPTSVAYGAQNATTHGYLIMDSADNTAAVCVEGRADVIAPEGGAVEPFYLEKLRENTDVWARLQGAELITKVHGMRKVGNLFRAAGGAGWALVGDAYHQKDPIDGQGIYDSVYSARTLAKAIIAWHSGRTTWADALQWYDTSARKQMQPQYEATLNRIQQQLYPTMSFSLPKELVATPLRWLWNDPQYRKLAGLALNRKVAPNVTLQPRVMMLAMLRGGLRELSDRLGESEAQG